jgi:hypothetical protein
LEKAIKARLGCLAWGVREWIFIKKKSKKNSKKCQDKKVFVVVLLRF